MHTDKRPRRDPGPLAFPECAAVKPGGRSWPARAAPGAGELAGAPARRPSAAGAVRSGPPRSRPGRRKLGRRQRRSRHCPYGGSGPPPFRTCTLARRPGWVRAPELPRGHGAVRRGTPHTVAVPGLRGGTVRVNLPVWKPRQVERYRGTPSGRPRSPY
ncbi:hypothetical protein GCM10010515_53860 [Streptomyces fructofermentans]|uniref:Uncharacterized protein n=1 Tax=Streptomyces fructofermentans TaxID=152141 RepID=A0A918U1M7_9ACTN|nr:hypothetical protein GCM10010515_53860 [Streptomyces fructofermentans]